MLKYNLYEKFPKDAKYKDVNCIAFVDKESNYVYSIMKYLHTIGDTAYFARFYSNGTITMVYKDAQKNVYEDDSRLNDIMDVRICTIQTEFNAHPTEKQFCA